MRIIVMCTRRSSAIAVCRFLCRYVHMYELVSLGEDRSTGVSDHTPHSQPSYIN